MYDMQDIELIVVESSTRLDKGRINDENALLNTTRFQ